MNLWQYVNDTNGMIQSTLVSRIHLTPQGLQWAHGNTTYKGKQLHIAIAHATEEVQMVRYTYDTQSKQQYKIPLKVIGYKWIPTWNVSWYLKQYHNTGLLMYIIKWSHVTQHDMTGYTLHRSTAWYLVTTLPYSSARSTQLWNASCRRYQYTW